MAFHTRCPLISACALSARRENTLARVWRRARSRSEEMTFLESNIVQHSYPARSIPTEKGAFAQVGSE